MVPTMLNDKNDTKCTPMESIRKDAERSKREDLCFCEYCEEDKQKREIAGFICKQCMQD